MNLRPALLATLIISAFATCVATAADYEIRFQRPVAVGDTYHATGTGSDEQSMLASIDGQPVQNRAEKYSVEYAADYEVLALTTTGRAAKAKLTIAKLIRTSGGESTELLPAGTVVTAEHVGRRTAFKQGDHAVAPLVSAALATLGVTMASDQQANDDQVFGTTGRKQVGDSWPINAELAAADLVKMGIPVTAANLSGQTTLAEVVSQDGGPVLRLTATMDIKGANPPLPPGLEVQSSVFTTAMSGLFPVDATKPVQQEGTSMVMEVKAGGTNNGRTMEMTMTKKTTRETSYTRK
jgi:hypothetical protein